MRKTHKFYLLTTTAAAVCLLNAPMALAADTAADAAPVATAGDDNQLEAIVVTGFRDSLMHARDIKRKAVGAVDVIVSEDIAAFPDLNLAESLQRIPGVTISRDSGEGRQITLRGLGPDFTRTQLNGMEVLGNTASGMDNRGGVSRSRAFDFSLFASELFDRVTVQKSYAAEQDEGGIGGTVQLSTAKPFDYKGFKAVLSAKAQQNSNVSGKTSPRVVGLISNRWGDFGALASIAYSESDSNEFGYRSFNWGPIRANPGNIGSGVSAADAARLTAATATIYAPQADTYSTWYDHRKRLGATVSLQYEPGDKLKLAFDGLYSQLENSRQNFALATSGVNSLTGNITGTQVMQSAVIQGNTLIASSYTGVDLRSEFNREEDKTKFYQLGLSGSYQATEKLLLSGLVGYSKSDYHLPVLDKVFLESKNHAFSFDDRPEMPVNTYDAGLTDPSKWDLMRMDTQENRISSEYKNAKFDLDYALNAISSVKGGVSYKKFVNSGAQWSDKEFKNVPANTIISNDLKLVVPYKSLGAYIVGNVDPVYAAIGQVRDLEAQGAKFATPGTNYTVTEETKAAYLQYELNTEILGKGVRANAGVRYYSTELTSDGTLNTGTSLQPVSIQHKYSGWLPAFNVAVDVNEGMVARFSANRDISRPALGDLAAAGSLTTAPFGGTISTGNPNLTPFTSDSVEGSLEFYDGKVGSFTIGVFYKKLKSFITAQTSIMPYSQTGFPLSFLLPGQDGTIPYNVSHPVNGPGADIQGLEIAFQRDFTFLPAPFDHLGVVANGTYADGSSPVIISGNSVNLPLFQLSKYTANATIYYETDRWGMRLSSAYRDKYLDGAGGNGNIGSGYKATNNIDFAAHYNVLPKLKLTLEGLNLSNEHSIQYTDVNAKRTTVNVSSGRTILVGATYEF
ncbi:MULTISPECIES: TonB-dependent receptor [Caulobacter]|jgi:iron complex outermembrane receptor protein|uniref:TonB-dependent receptor n=1 Tax=Caulobacter vibrioides OR37 TaxID=1292034 RepID=R0E5K0_CAUVI|nr:MULTISPECIES: TonB-dependent receptor [Caulobacter]ENZ80843.1 TonB-dependent receptor [Caulobacter vibrioides OR37]MBQ1559447.1 TonB-dependent receptor [Caulobacter sp.]